MLLTGQLTPSLLQDFKIVEIFPEIKLDFEYFFTPQQILNYHDYQQLIQVIHNPKEPIQTGSRNARQILKFYKKLPVSGPFAVRFFGHFA